MQPQIKLDIGTLHVSESGAISLLKTRKEKSRSIGLALLIPILVIIGLCWLSFTGRANLSKVNMFYLILLLMVIGLPLMADFIRSVKIARDYVLWVTDGKVMLNNRHVTNLPEIKHIFIQPVSGWKGIGRTYTVGFSSNRRKWSVSFNNTERSKAVEVAIDLAKVLNSTVIEQQPTVFTLYKGY